MLCVCYVMSFLVQKDRVTPYIVSLQEGRTAISLASYQGHSDTVRILVQRGADTDVQDQVKY